MPLTGIYGEMGSGKTLFMTMVAYHASLASNAASSNSTDGNGNADVGKNSNPNSNPNYTSTLPIFSNYTLHLPNSRKLEPDMLLEMPYERAMILIDEAYTWLESFTSGSRLARYLNYILFQSRKRGLDIFLTAQLPRTVTIRFRELATRNVYCSKIEGGFKFVIEKPKIDSPFVSTFFLPAEKAEKYYTLYDTKEIVMTQGMKELGIEFVIQDRDRFKDLVNKAVKQLIMSGVSFATRDAVELALIEHGYSPKLTKYVYAKLKQHKNNGNGKGKDKEKEEAEDEE